VAKNGLLDDRPIRHPELRPEVLREESDSIPIGVSIGLHQVLHGLDQQFLTLNVAFIADTWSAASLRVGDYGEGK
jgi:hypothetical protein